jgi:eukaryotic-like serine/threonine-protein kinase
MLRAGLLVALLLVAVLPTAEADWTSFHNDSRNSGYVPFSAYPVYEDEWWVNKTAGNYQIRASPVIKDGILITADMSGLVRALSASDGKELWNHKMPARVEGTPVIAGQRVFVVDSAGNLKGLGLTTGTVELPDPTKPATAVAVGSTLGSLTEHEGYLYVGNEAGQVKAYQTSTLTLIWTYNPADVSTTSTSAAGVVTCGPTKLAGKPVRSAPAVVDGNVIFGSMNHYVVAVNEQGTADGKAIVQWIYGTGSILTTSPTVMISGSTHRAIIGNHDGKVYAFDTAPGGQGANKCYGVLHSPVWTYEIPSVVDPNSGTPQITKIESSAATTGSRVFIGANNGQVYALDTSSGTKVWNTTAGSVQAPIWSSPAVANNIVVVGSNDKNVYWLDANNGAILKKFPTQSAVVTSPAIDGDRAFVASEDGTLYSFGPKIPTLPDVVVESITAVEGAIQVVVKNNGDAASAATTVRVFLAGEFLASLDVGALEVGKSQTVTHDIELEEGRHSVKAIVDPDSSMAEHSDSNNELEKNVNAVLPQEETETDGGDGGGGGLKIPSPGAVPLLALLGLLALALRRRK